MSNKLKSFLINLSLLFMIAELSYINSKSLSNLAGSGQYVHQAFAIVGAIAFSLVTIIVMQQPNLKWQKVVFPVFDAALVFLGFNLDYHPDMRIYLTVFMALFAGCIMYSLGKIEYHQGESKEGTQLDERNTLLNKARLELEQIKSNYQETKSKLEQVLGDYARLESDHKRIDSNYMLVKSKLEVIEPKYIKHELGRLRKKNPDNLTPEEKEFLNHHQKNLVA